MTDVDRAGRRWYLTRRQWFATTIGAAAGLGAVNAFGVQPNRVTVTRHRIGQAGAPAVRIVQLTDLHLREIGSHERRIADTVAELRPDLLLFTGDTVDRRDSLPLLDDFLAMLPSGHQALAILGNWEHWGDIDLTSLERVYGRRGIRLLRNESVTLSLPVGELLVTGLDDLVGGKPDVEAALRGMAPARNHLLLAHCPAHRDALAHGTPALPGTSPLPPSLLRPQLMLAGHTHGGQVRLGGWVPFRPQGSGRYVSGWYRGGDMDLYVSRGLGTSVIPARVGSPPEVALFEWSLAT